MRKKKHTGNHLLFLIIGLLLGGGLVLATLLIAGTFSRNNGSDDSNASENRTEKISTANRNVSSLTNADVFQNNTNQIDSGKIHEEKTSAGDDAFNGRVITLNAYVRSAPSKNATETDVLPMSDRINIGERENPNSPWYRVTCEHGASGWMHGDTIEFTK